MQHKPIWRFLWDEPTDPEYNMAVDEAIALSFSKGKGLPTLRLYRWNRPTISLGVFQKAPDNGPLQKEPILLVRRITGGRALFHHHDLTYSVVAATDTPPFSEGISKTYQALSQGIVIGLENVGVDAAIRIPSKTKGSGRTHDWHCFDVTSGYEITARGKKLVGSAQRRFKNCFLQQGSLGLEKSPAPFMSENQVTLSELLPMVPSLSALQKGFKEGFEKALSIRLEEGFLDPEESALARHLFQNKYASDLWTRDRTDPTKDSWSTP